jgi:hypothetical protein
MYCATKYCNFIYVYVKMLLYGIIYVLSMGLGLGLGWVGC